jgi:arylsulfatase A-like enzyme
MVILADDLGTGDIPGYWGTNQVPMPNVDDLIQKGVVFTDAHSTPLCAPSRYVLLSGNYQHRGRKYSGTFHFNYEGSQFHPEQKSIADVLREEGQYHTAMIGKWHLGAKVPTRDGVIVEKGDEVDLSRILRDERHDWSKELSGGPGDIGFDYSYITSEGIHQPPFAFIRNGYLDMDLSAVKFWDKGEYEMPKGTSKIKEEGDGVSTWDSSAYNQILVEETKSFLDHHADTRPDDPFFTYVSLGSVHIPHSPPNTYMDGTTPINGTQPSPHMDLISEIDMIVGSLTQELKDRQLLEDTIILFTSDNGGLPKEKSKSPYNSNGPELRGKKRDIYEGGHRVPFILRWDNGGIPAGEKSSQLIGLNDVFATLCDLVGIAKPDRQGMDSMSFTPSLFNEESSNTRQYLGVWTYFYNNGRLRQQSIRKDNYKLVFNYNLRDQGENVPELSSRPIKARLRLYDLDADISERTNIYDGNSSALVDEMFAELQTIGPCFDDKFEFSINTNGEVKNKTCDWFQTNDTYARCTAFPEGRKHCRFTCESDKNECKDYEERLAP